MTVELNYQYFQNREPKLLSIFPIEAKGFMERCYIARVDIERYQDGRDNKRWISFVEGLYGLVDECRGFLTYFFTRKEIGEFVYQELPHVRSDGRIFNLNEADRILGLAASLYSEQDMAKETSDNDPNQASMFPEAVKSHRQNILGSFSTTFEVLAQMLRWIYTSRRLHSDNASKAIEHATTLAKAHNFPFSGQVPNPYDG